MFISIMIMVDTARYGIEYFSEKAALITDELKKRELKFPAAFTTKFGNLHNWQVAVAVAMDVLYALDLSVLVNLKPKSKDIKNDSNDIKPVGKMRKSILKYLLSNGSSNNRRPSLYNESDREDSLSNDSLHEILECDSDIKRERQRPKKCTSMQPPEFEVYLERNEDIVREQHPDVTDEEIRSYLMTICDEMSAHEKQK